MRTDKNQLAVLLKEARDVSKDGIIKSSDIPVKTRLILIKKQFLSRIIRGWYFLTTQKGSGSSTAWYSVYWSFLKYYLADRFGETGYCLSANASLDYHAGETIIPKQIIILTRKHSNTKIDLSFDTSLMMYTDEDSFPNRFDTYDQVNIMPLEYAIVKCPLNYYQQNPVNIEIALKRIQSSEMLSRIIIEKGLASSADRIIGAYRYLNENKLANELTDILELAGYKINPINPFNNYRPSSGGSIKVSPYAIRIKSMWERMREDVIYNFPELPDDNVGIDIEKINLQIEQMALQDAYNSLSIEGYRISDNLIRKIQSGEWDIDNNSQDRSDIDALAAKGYNQAFIEVKNSITRALQGIHPGTVFKEDLSKWYLELFKPRIQAGLLQIGDVLGYRNSQVYIKNTKHVPPPANAVPDSMEILFELLQNEKNPAARAVLGHYFFVYIHPYMDGNGRIGRFLMNVMLVTGGYNWTIIRNSERADYMRTLDLVMIEKDIISFTKFVASELLYWKDYGNKKIREIGG